MNIACGRRCNKGYAHPSDPIGKSFSPLVRHFIQRSFRSRIDDEIPIGPNRDNKQFVESFRVRGRFTSFVTQFACVIKRPPALLARTFSLPFAGKSAGTGFDRFMRLSQCGDGQRRRSRSLLVERIASGVPWLAQSQWSATQLINWHMFIIWPLPVGPEIILPCGSNTRVNSPTSNRSPNDGSSAAPRPVTVTMVLPF